MSTEKSVDEAELAREALPPTLLALRAEKWLKENKPSLDTYNAFVEKYGVFSDGLRGF